LKHSPQSPKLGVLQLEHGFVHLKHGPLGWEYCSFVEGVALAPIFQLNCIKIFQRFHHDVELGPLATFVPSNQFHQFNWYLDGVFGLPKVFVGSHMGLASITSLMHLLMLIELEINMYTLFLQLC
jgi:hypothetical protein